MAGDFTSWSLKIPYPLPNHVAIIFFLSQKSHGCSKMIIHVLSFLLKALKPHRNRIETKILFGQKKMLSVSVVFCSILKRKKVKEKMSFKSHNSSQEQDGDMPQ